MHLSEYTHFNRTRNEHEGVRDNEKGNTCDSAWFTNVIKRFSIIIYKLNRVLIEAIYIVKVFFKPKDLKPHNYFLKSQFCFYNFIISNTSLCTYSILLLNVYMFIYSKSLLPTRGKIYNTYIRFRLLHEDIAIELLTHYYYSAGVNVLRPCWFIVSPAKLF